MIEKNTLHLTVNSAAALTEALHLTGRQAVSRTARVEIEVNGTVFLRETIVIENIAVPVVLTGENAVFDGGYRFTDITKAGRNGKTVLRLKPDAGISEKLCRDALFADGNRRFRCSRAVGLMGMTEENGVLRDADEFGFDSGSFTVLHYLLYGMDNHLAVREPDGTYTLTYLSEHMVDSVEKLKGLLDKNVSVYHEDIYQNFGNVRI